MPAILYQRLTVRYGDNFFCVFCTQESLDKRPDEIKRWVDQLADRLSWKGHQTSFSSASQSQAEAKKHALFENCVSKVK